jgi:MFS family permease
MVALAAFIVLSSTGGTDFGWTSSTALLYGAVIAVATVGFALWERRAPEPVLPLRLFDDRVIRGNAGVNFTSGLLLYCGIFFVPLFMQEVHGISPTSSGLVLTPVMFGAAFGTMVSGRAVERTGRIKVWPIAGSVSALTGVALLATLTASTPTALAALYVLLVGLGAGLIMQPSLLAIQNAAGPTDLGTATSTGLLFRMLGSTVGVPVFGGIINASIGDGPRNATTFADALPPVFLAAVPVALVSLVFALRTPERPLRDHHGVLAEPVV